MLLTTDIGNSRIKAGLFENNKLTQFKSFQDISEILNLINKNHPDSIAVASVVPDKTGLLAAEVKKLTGKNIFLIDKEIKTNLKILYKTPATLGADRVCSAEGAFYLFKNSDNYSVYNENTYILSIDFGTATTLNLVEYPGNFIGGLIAPGIGMMFESLKQKTAQLPLLDVKNFISVIGDDTNSSIAGGIVNSAIGMIERTINYLKNEKTANEIVIFITGGNAEKIMPHFNFEFVYEEALVLYGINALWELNK